MALRALANPLVSPDQLQSTSSNLDGIPEDLEQSLRFAGARLTQSTGCYLRLSQETIAQAIVIFYRFYMGAEGGSFAVNACKDISAAALYLTAKISARPISPRDLLNAYAFVTSKSSPLMTKSKAQESGSNPATSSDSKFVKSRTADGIDLDDAEYYRQRQELFLNESRILRTIAFCTTFVSPFRLAITYLKTLSLVSANVTPESTNLIRQVTAHLNTALLSPQLLYLTHQPSALATAAIYLAARQCGIVVSSSADEWWQIFDVDREQLGFLVVALLSVQGWVDKENEGWSTQKTFSSETLNETSEEDDIQGCPLDLQGLRSELDRRKNLPAMQNDQERG